MLFTDVEGSTRLLGELGPDRYASVLMDHRERLRSVAQGRGGVEMGTEGDAFFFVFQSARECLAAAGEMQAALADLPLRVRMGVHSGEVLLVEGSYFGMAVHKAARISSSAHGGQVVVSAQTRALTDATLRDLGEHRLKDLAAPERLFQLGDETFPQLRTLRQVHLPVQATPLIGRERELAELLDLSDSHRLVTLTGTGGTGKTRLALALAAELADRYADGVWWVSLAAVTDAAVVMPTIATAVGAGEDLPGYMSGRSLLLVLDNLEQVLDAAPVVGELLGGAPGCAAIATSRERLAIAGEQEYPVGPLSPAGAVELFNARARQVKPDFAPGDAVDAICARLDRLPLALELAATRVKLLSESQLLSRLQQRLPLLAGGARDLPERQATMRAAIAWSYDLLSEREQRVFVRLGGFVGGFELEAAEQICEATLDDLQSLVDKSLLRQGDSGRFFLLETTREYALEHFEASDDRDQVRARHARWYFALGIAAGRQDADREDALARVRRDSGNIGLALAWALDHDIAAGLPLADAVFLTWLGAGRNSELRQWYERAVENPEALSPDQRADALTGLGHTLTYSEAPEPARTALTEALTLYREAGDERNEARVLARLGAAEFISGSPEGVIKWVEQALPINERLNDQEGIARSLFFMAEGLRDSGELERAAELYKRSIDIHREHDLGSVSALLHSLGDLYADKADLPIAERYYHEALALAPQEDNPRLVAYCLAGLAGVAAKGDDAEAAGRLWSLAERLEQQIGFRMLRTERARYERTLTPELRDSDEYRAGVAHAAELDPLTAAAELFRR